MNSRFLMEWENTTLSGATEAEARLALMERECAERVKKLKIYMDVVQDCGSALVTVAKQYLKNQELAFADCYCMRSDEVYKQLIEHYMKTLRMYFGEGCPVQDIAAAYHQAVIDCRKGGGDD